jgi:hypothetical protein
MITRTGPAIPLAPSPVSLSWGCCGPGLIKQYYPCYDEPNNQCLHAITSIQHHTIIQMLDDRHH